MPQLIRTPDEIFRAEPGKTLYYIEFNFPGKMSSLHGLKARSEAPDAVEPIDPAHPPGQAELLDWFATHWPAVHIELLAPREGSGFVCGGIDGRLRVDFDEAALAGFVERWETADGASVDPRWQCFAFPYERWLHQRHPRTEALIETQPTLTTVRGETISTYALTPLWADETGLPCTLGLYWDMDEQGLTPRVLLYRGTDPSRHLSLDIADPTDGVGDIGLSAAELAQCQQAITARRDWLLERFEGNSELVTQTLAYYHEPPREWL